MKHRITIAVTIVSIIISFFLFRNESYCTTILIVIALFYGAMVAYGSSQIKANYFIHSINRGKVDAVSFTFDDGPDKDITPKILELLEAENIKATFFVIGKKAAQHPELLKLMNEKGHTIANHSYSHSNMIGFFSSGRLKADIEHCTVVIRNAIEKTPLFFRPPFGVTNPIYASVLHTLSLTSIGWSLRSMDTVTTNEKQLVNKVTSSIDKTSIVLFHDTKKITLEALPEIIKYCRQKNLNIIPLPELIHAKPYEDT